ncbi:MAG: hypothetical protein A2V88_03405 [Elusimicrobia bacterium RBG_16_66_12]|nr:MAG: hypothetical protein A2V88_03405 [Elusimicrobia bacterium RBG_16_66_12]
MIFSWPQVAAFFGALVVAGWLVYPSEYFRGQMFRDEGSRSRSIAFFKDYLGRHPFHKGATRALATAYEAAGRPEEGVSLLQAFYRHRRGDAESGRHVLDYMESAGLAEAASAFRRELLADLKDRPSADRRWLEGIMYEDFQQAVLAQDDAKAKSALEALAEVAAEGSSFRDEILRRLLARRDFAAALAMLKEQAAREPGNAEPRRMIVRVRRLMNDRPAALAAIQEGLGRFPNDAWFLAERVDLHMERKACQDALPDLKTLMSLQPEEMSWPREIGSCLVGSGKVREGVRFFERMLQSDPSDKASWWNVVYAYSDHGMYGDSSAWLEKFLQRFPDDAAGLDMLVYEYEVMERPDGALKALDRHLASAPGNLKRAKQRASLLVQEDRYPASAQAYEALIPRVKDEQELRQLWNNLIYQYESHGDYAKERDAVERFLRRFPGDGKGYDKLFSLNKRQGRRDQAIDAFKDYFRRKGVPVPADPIGKGETVK